MICCSRTSFALMQRLKALWERQSPKTEFITVVKCKSLPEYSEEKSLTECVGEWFFKVDAIVFLCAVGIAVRSIAPYLVHKAKDPAVVAADETGRFVISLLSGHAGGANELALNIAKMLGAVPVITTATDRERLFAVDDFARKNKLWVRSWELAKEISVRILEGERIGLCCKLPVEGELPWELILQDEKPLAEPAPQDEKPLAEPALQDEKLPPEPALQDKKLQAGILISDKKTDEYPYPVTLQLVPRDIVIGIGCRKNAEAERIRAAVEGCFEEEGLLPEAAAAVASIDLKKQEEGILAFCRERKLPFLTFTAQELSRQQGEFTASDFVKQITGVSNVSERSAAAAGGRLLGSRRIYDGVTVALARTERSVRF